MTEGRNGQAQATDREFVRATVTLPRPVFELGQRLAQDPRYAGNFSALVRTLILDAPEEKAQTSAK